jgi:hypothetical protein
MLLSSGTTLPTSRPSQCEAKTLTSFPRTLSAFRKAYSFNANNFFTTTNPKTLKNGKVSDRPTIVLHLEPVTFGACPAAGSCAAVCLNRAGNPVYLNNKLARRHKRSLAFYNNSVEFKQLLVVEAARQRKLGYIGVRLNGTSDIDWERETVFLEPNILQWVRDMVPTFAIRMPGTYSLMAVLTGMGFEPYDYTKRVDRDFALAAAFNYHLTLSWGGRHDNIILDVARKHRLNVAAGIAGIKKSQSLPDFVTVGSMEMAVVDGDVTDWRRDDPTPSALPHIVGLRIKRTPGQTAEQVKRFAIA